MTLLSNLKSLGFIKDCTNFDALEKLLEEQQQTFYVGTDLTADGKKLKEYYPVLRTMIIGTQHGIGIHKMIELIG